MSRGVETELANFDRVKVFIINRGLSFSPRSRKSLYEPSIEKHCRAVVANFTFRYRRVKNKTKQLSSSASE